MRKNSPTSFNTFFSGVRSPSISSRAALAALRTASASPVSDPGAAVFPARTSATVRSRAWRPTWNDPMWERSPMHPLDGISDPHGRAFAGLGRFIERPAGFRLQSRPLRVRADDPARRPVGLIAGRGQADGQRKDREDHCDRAHHRSPLFPGRLFGLLLEDLEEGRLRLGRADLAERLDGGLGQPAILALGDLEQGRNGLVALGLTESVQGLFLELTVRRPFSGPRGGS